MKKWSFKQWNTITGWLVFLISTITFISTVEPNFSFWDTGEYISSAVKLEVTHAPGAALFQILGAVGGIFAFGNGANYSLVINIMSALYSSFTVLFLFWTITHLTRRLFEKDLEEITVPQQIATLFAGVIGALAFTFSDTFWYSAVEGEVYSMASLFIALILWVITKWENEFHDPANERWIILIFFLVGLSVGVHMMAMLVIPAVCLIYYARNYQFSWKSFLYANLVTLLILSIVFKGIFPVIMTVFGKMEIFFVNGIGLPFHSGTIAAFIMMIIISYFGIKYARKSNTKIWQSIALSIVYMMIGFSCWLVIPIRANANPPMNLNNPDTAIGMLDYYNREQYGDWPIFYGHNYTAHLDANGIQKNEDGSYKTKKQGEIYEKDEKTGSYRLVGERFDYVYSPEHVSFMPRMYNQDKTVMSNYIAMYGAPDFTFNYNNPDIVDSSEAQKIFNDLRAKFEDGSISVNDYLQVKNYDLISIQRPSLLDNLDYFINFQNGEYFWRYLMWNFVGRQNDLEWSNDDFKGNWISGFSFIDDFRLGDQKMLPAEYKNANTVAFYFLPFLLALVGFFFQLNRDFGRFYAILSLFILTSVGIIFYTGVKPFEPRERDYAMVGSFYAFAIWIGLGAAAILWGLQNKLKSKWTTLVLGIILLGIPMMMGFKNYRSHDRSERYAAYDYAVSVLKSLPKNNILFVYGDNDTYPVWGLQETENFRDDVKVVNFTLLATSWNVDQVKRKTYNAPPVPGKLTHEEYREGMNDQIMLFDKESLEGFIQNHIEKGVPESTFDPFKKYISQDSMTVQEAIQFIKKKSPEKDEVLKLLFGDERYERLNFLPVSKFILPVNKENAVKSGTIQLKDLPFVEDFLTIQYKSGSMFKNNLIMLDILADFDWKRTINFSNGGIYDSENIFYLDDYLQFDGFSYRLVPIKTKTREDGEMGRVDALSLYQTVKNFRWGNFKNKNVHFDDTSKSNILGYRNSASRAAEALVLIGEKQKALEILNLASQEIPIDLYNDPKSLASIVYGYALAGNVQKAIKMANQLKENILKEFDYYQSLPSEKKKYLSRAFRTKAMEYAMIVGAISDAYTKMNQKEKGYDYLLKSIEPVDKRFKVQISTLEKMGKEKALTKAIDVQKLVAFYQDLFDVMQPYDSTFAKEKEEQIMNAIMRVTN